MVWMQHASQISLKRYALSMEDKMAAGALGRARSYGRDGPVDTLDFDQSVLTYTRAGPLIITQRLYI